MHRRHAHSGSDYEVAMGFSRAVRHGDTVHVSGTAPIRADGGVDPDVDAQAARCFEVILAALAQVGARREDVIRTRMYLVDAADAEVVGQVHERTFGDVRPAATMVVVAGLLDDRWRVEIEAEAQVIL